MALRVIRTFKIGPRRITKTGHSAAVYLGRTFIPYVGMKVLLTVEILEEVPDNLGSKVEHKPT